VRIAGVTTTLLTGPSTGDPWLLPFKRLRSAAFVEIRLDSGVVGIGETYAGYFFPEAVPLVVDYLAPVLTGATPFDDPADLDPSVLGARMRLCCAYWGRTGLGAAVISGIEAALWDLKGKLLGVPVHELLGGAKHRTLPTYATGGPAPWPPDALLRKVDHYLSLGFPAVKVSSGYVDLTTRAEVPGDPVAVEVDKLAMLRANVGPDVGLLLDGHMGHREGPDRWTVEVATAVLAAIAPYDVLLFEEPLPYGDPAGYAELCASSPVPIAGGEQLSTVDEFRQFAFSVAQPDAAWLGVEQFGTVATMFDAVAPHAWGAGGAVMQNVHAAFAAPNTLVVELPPDAGPLHTEVWGDSLRFHNGHLRPPDTPGLGIELSPSVRDRFPFIPGAEEFASVPGKLMRS
jgi:L-alanine-DL-glutamate epimerase-like enolase superfamily enzyme